LKIHKIYNLDIKKTKRENKILLCKIQTIALDFQRAAKGKAISLEPNGFCFSPYFSRLNSQLNSENVYENFNNKKEQIK